MVAFLIPRPLPWFLFPWGWAWASGQASWVPPWITRLRGGLQEQREIHTSSVGAGRAAVGFGAALDRRSGRRRWMAGPVADRGAVTCSCHHRVIWTPRTDRTEVRHRRWPGAPAVGCAFMSDTADLGLLLREGKGYRFQHLILSDYLAGLPAVRRAAARAKLSRVRSQFFHVDRPRHAGAFGSRPRKLHRRRPRGREPARRLHVHDGGRELEQVLRPATQATARASRTAGPSWAVVIP